MSFPEARLYSTLSEDPFKCKCHVCAWGCVLKENQRGKCNIRVVKNNKLCTLAYGKAIATHVDPIEKKPLYHVLPGSPIYSFGNVGCNFSCLFCQNYTISQASSIVDRCFKTQDFESMGIALSPEQIVQTALRKNIKAIAQTYTEPVIAFEYMFDSFKLAKEHGIKTVAVTNGYWTEESVTAMAPHLDAMNIDLKGDDQFYRKLCGGVRLEPVQQTIKRAFELGIHVEVTNLVIEGHNSSDEQLRELCQYVASVSTSIPLHFSACYPTYKLMDISRTSVATLERAASIADSEGLKYVYLGNIPEHPRSHSYCFNCKEKVIHRSKTGGVQVLLDEGRCPKCTEFVYGIWK
ncbi:hypothetical protein GEMRC1_011495 [Eukaryota sp. GEM-RC1]